MTQNKKIINIEKITEALGGKKSKDGYICHCPAHDDKNPSLSVTEKNDKILFHCFAGCSQEQVIDQLKAKGLWPSAVFNAARLNVKQEATPDLSKTAVGYYESTSEEVEKYLQNERMISKETITAFGIGQRSDRITIPIPDKNGIITDIRGYLPPSKRQPGDAKVLPNKGGDASPKLFPQQVISWLKLGKKAEEAGNLENVEKLGNLEYQKVSKFIVLCEGELDALALLSNEVIALTNTCGANTWSDDFSRQIKAIGLPVIILMDNDQAGATGAIKRADSLMENNVDVSIAKWPSDRKTGHDVTDELKANGLAGIFQILDSSEQQSDIIFMNNVVAEPVDWLFKPYLAIGKTSLLEGEPGIGKSFLSLSIASLTSVGGVNPINNEDIFPKGKVLLMSAEDGLGDTIKPRLERMIADLTKIFAPKEIFTLDDAGFDKLEQLISRENPILVIIDPLTPFLDGKKDVNHAKDMRPFFKRLGKLAAQYGCAILITRHLAKSKDLTGISRGLGSIDIAAAVRSILQVTSDKENSRVKRVTHVKCNIAAKGKPFGYALEDNEFKFITDISEVEDLDDQNETDRVSEFLKDALASGPVDAKEIEQGARDAAISKSTLNRAKKRLKIRSKRITSDGKTQLWQWSLPNQQESQGDQGSQDSQDSHLDQKPFKHFNETDSDRE